ncbi:MAG: hypothetical protein ABI112_10520 [Terracoccus sp.]
MQVRVLGTLAAAGALALSGGPAIAAGSSARTPMAYTCTGGDIPSGHYLRITVKGACQVPADAQIRVVGNVNVAAGAVLDAQTASSTITVGGNVTGAKGSIVGLGCQPPSFTGNSAHTCIDDPDGHSTITVKGNVTAFGAGTVLLNGITVKGDVTLIGGGGPMPWSIKNNTIGRNITVAGQTTDWLGVLFNSVRGNVTLLYIKVTDTDKGAPGAYVVRNTIGQNLICAGVTPGISGGFKPGEVNVVGRRAYGQCKTLV